jgi:hypothetical protein
MNDLGAVIAGHTHLWGPMFTIDTVCRSVPKSRLIVDRLWGGYGAPGLEVETTDNVVSVDHSPYSVYT